ncbi:MAG: hypothetical protein U5K69_28455 [Balneolaceae bacterium]|nr:hypothetical protein [Balneolaceae bacterium]
MRICYKKLVALCSAELLIHGKVVKNGIMNTMVPEPEIPSHQGPDAQSVDPELDVVTAAVKVPQTLSICITGPFN